MKLMKTNIKKQVLFFSAVLFSIFLGIIIPLHFSQAFLGSEWIGMWVIGWAIAGGLQIILTISNLILGLAGVLLNWVLSPYFMSLPYIYDTDGNLSGIVAIGWPIVRDFINMFFILALVVIGLATALRLKEYQAQKALPVLIIIAVLINFTPVICGLIIDASNILMNFFLEELTGFKLIANIFSAQGSALLASWGDISALNFARLAAAPLVLIAKTLIMIIFSLVTAFILFMYTLLFIMRYVMIWVLVIVSPIAFFSRIFPKTQKGEYLFKSILGWDEWWKQFFEWTLIGVTAAFFLYLGEQLMVVVSATGFMPGIPPEGAWYYITAPIVEFMNVLLPWCVVLAFLFIGWMVAMDTKALGAKHITGTFKKMGKAMGTAAVVAAPSVMAGMAGGAAKGFQGGQGITGKLGGGVAGIFTGGFTKEGRKEGVDWAKEKIIPPDSIREKVYGGLKESLVGEIGGPGVRAAAKKWGVSEWFEKEKKPEEKQKKPERPEMPDLTGLSEEESKEQMETYKDEWEEYEKKMEEYNAQETSSAEPEKKGIQTTLGQPAKPTEKGEKETKTPNRENEIEALKAKKERIWKKWTDPKTSMEKKEEYRTEFGKINKEIRSFPEKIDKEIKEEKEWKETFKENPEDSKKMKKTKKTGRNKLEKLTNAREDLIKGNREIERIDEEADLLEQEIESSRDEKLKGKSKQDLLKKTKYKNKISKETKTIQKKIDKIISKIDKSQEKIKAEQDLTAPATPSAAPVTSKIEKLKIKQDEVWEKWNSPGISMEKKEEYRTEFGKIKKEMQSITEEKEKEEEKEKSEARIEELKTRYKEVWKKKEKKEIEEKEKEEKLEKLMKEAIAKKKKRGS